MKLPRKCLVKVKEHFHGLRSIPAFLNRSYYCHHCEKSYNQETSENTIVAAKTAVVVKEARVHVLILRPLCHL